MSPIRPTTLWLTSIIGIGVGFLAGMNLHRFQNTGGNNPVVAKFNGTSIQSSEVFAAIKSQLFQAEEEIYRLKERAISDFIEGKLLEAEAKKQNLTLEKLLSQVSTGEFTISDKEIDDFMASKGLKLDDPRFKKDSVREYLRYRKQYEKKQDFVADLKKKSDFKILIEKPQAAKIELSLNGYPAWGKTNAKSTLVVFSDFQSKFSLRAFETTEQLKTLFGEEKLRVVFRDLPQSLDDQAIMASLAAHCAGDQGKFWEMHAALFKNSSDFSKEALLKLAESIQLKSDRFTSCLDKKEHKNLIEQSKREAESLGIRQAPALVINGQLTQGLQSLDELKKLIE